jgi:hypothetical protein
MVRVQRMESTNIYFIRNVELDAVKIGRSNNPKKRLAELQTGHSHKLVLYHINYLITMLKLQVITTASSLTLQK